MARGLAQLLDGGLGAQDGRAEGGGVDAVDLRVEGRGEVDLTDEAQALRDGELAAGLVGQPEPAKTIARELL
eukprot:952638-Alexandrium_andersonii.AAC.1